MSNFAAEQTGIVALSIPSSITQIGPDAFKGCTGLGGGIVIVDGCMFAVSTSYTTSLNIGSNVRVISGDVWANCPNLQNVTVSSSNKDFRLVENMLCSADGLFC